MDKAKATWVDPEIHPRVKFEVKGFVRLVYNTFPQKSTKEWVFNFWGMGGVRGRKGSHSNT